MIINQIARQISKQIGCSHTNVHASISKLINRLGVEPETIEYKIENNKLTELGIGNHYFKRGASNKWVAQSELTNRTIMLNKQSMEYANRLSLSFSLPPAEPEPDEILEAFVFEHKGRRIEIPVSDDPDYCIET